MFHAIIDIMFTTLIIRENSTSCFMVDQLSRIISFLCFDTRIIFKKKSRYIFVSCTLVQQHSYLFENVIKNAFERHCSQLEQSGDGYLKGQSRHGLL